MKINEVLILSKYAGKKLERDFDFQIKSSLEEMGIGYEILAGNKTNADDMAGMDMAISFGGDGTVLDASKNIGDETPLLAVKSSDESLGALCKISADEFDGCMKRILDDDFFIEKWDRVEGNMNGKSYAALNEIYVGPRFGSGPGRYDMIFNGIIEKDHRSSGVVISTGTGSTGWYNNLQYSEGPFAKDSGILKFAARDCRKSPEHMILSGTIHPGGELEIISRYKFDGNIDFDGYYRRSMDFPSGSSVKIKLSDKPLNVIAFPEKYK